MEGQLVPIPYVPFIQLGLLLLLIVGGWILYGLGFVLFLLLEVIAKWVGKDATTIVRDIGR